ncbi:PD40 domain-containing protein [Clostridium akagii]|uniref:PD40 domain-containing protein n=1 Tax=Clostridium akagii TaxID=91623 RepID=UPI0004789FAE|nr:PD40 domain-containing protein [Clostridium akagii]
MRNKNILFFLMFILILYTLGGCGIKSNEDLLIISSPNNNNKIVNYYEYDISKQKLNKLYSINKTCYPTAALSNDGKILYFTKSDKNGYPQLFQRNLNTHEEKQLTTKEGDKIINVDFLKINYKKNLIYLRTVQKDHRNFNLSIYDIRNNRLNVLDKNEKDLSDQFFDFANSSNSILVFQNSEQEKFNLMDSANKSKNFNYSINNKMIIKDWNGKDKKNYRALKSNIVDVSISPNKQSAIILAGELVNFSEHKVKKQIILASFDNVNEPKSILSTNGRYQDITKICFSKDGKGFYFVASESSNQYKVYYYDLKNKTILTVLKIDNDKILDCIETHK